VKRWTTFPALVVATLLTGCGTGLFNTNTPAAPIVVVPAIPPYSQDFQNQLADEIEADGRVPCPPDFIVPDCSAWKRAIIDYGFLRDQIRVLD